MRAIIVAAGSGSRLRPYTDDKPKCLLDIGGKTILQRAIDALRQNGIEEIIVVRGYRGEMINLTDVTYYENPRFMENNILESLFCAEAEMDEGFVFSYSDILYSSEVVSKLMVSRADTALTVDIGWMQRYKGRDQHPISEAELVTVKDGRVVKIGKGIIDLGQAHGEFIGLAKFTELAVESMKKAYHRASGKGKTKPFQQAISLEKAYMTDMIQELIDTGCAVKTVDIKGGWVEIDTPQDVEEAHRRFASSQTST